MRWVALAMLIAACGSRPPAQTPANRDASDARPTPEQCDELLEALVDLSWRAVAASNATWGNDSYGEERFMHKKEQREAHGPALLARCKRTPLREVKCAITASDLHAAAACGGELTLK